jgi:transposase
LSRGDLTDAEWRIFDPLLPDRGERGPPISDKRRTVNGILWVLRTDAPWRNMPTRYGAYDSNAIRDDLKERVIEPVIPPKSNRTEPIGYDREAYKRRNLIERCVNALKQFRRIC